MNSFRWLVLGCLLCDACSVFEAKEATYLRGAQDRATQEEVRDRFGRPDVIKAVTTGGSIWVYQIRQEQSGSRMTAPGMWCDEYAITFDQEGILRRWTHRSEFHGGDPMAISCVTGDSKPAP